MPAEQLEQQRSLLLGLVERPPLMPDRAHPALAAGRAAPGASSTAPACYPIGTPEQERDRGSLPPALQVGRLRLADRPLNQLMHPSPSPWSSTRNPHLPEARAERYYRHGTGGEVNPTAE